MKNYGFPGIFGRISAERNYVNYYAFILMGLRARRNAHSSVRQKYVHFSAKRLSRPRHCLAFIKPALEPRVQLKSCTAKYCIDAFKGGSFVQNSSWGEDS